MNMTHLTEDPNQQDTSVQDGADATCETGGKVPTVRVNCIGHSSRTIRVPGHAFWLDECTS